MWTCQKTAIFRKGSLQKLKIHEVVLSRYARNQVSNLPISKSSLTPSKNMVRRTCWNSLDLVIHFGKVLQGTGFAIQSSNLHFKVLFKYHQTKRCIISSHAKRNALKRKMTSEMTRGGEDVLEHLELATRATWKPLQIWWSRRKMTSHLMTRGEDVLQHLELELVLLATSCRTHFLPARLHLERTSVTILLRDQTSAPSKGKWTTLLDWSVSISTVIMNFCYLNF